MIHHVYANRSNAGDWLSARGIQALLGLPVVEHLCDDPFVPDTIATLQRLGGDDLIVIGGGGLFMDYFTPFWERLLAEVTAPFLVWGAGVVDLKREQTVVAPDLLRNVAERADTFHVRDDHTRELVGLPGLPLPALCPSALAVPQPLRGGWGLTHSANLTTVGEDVFDLMSAHAEAFATATGRPIRTTNNRMETNERALSDVFRCYASSDVILSSRLHGCIIGLAMGRPVLAVSGDRKVEAFMDAIGLGDWVLAQEDMDLLPSRLREVETQTAPPGFVDRVIVENLEIARTVRRHAGAR